MENLEGGISKPSGQQVTCFIVSTIGGLMCPLVGIVQGAICLFMD